MKRDSQTVFFIVNLLQDVSILRGLAYLTARETDVEIIFLVTPAFRKRDRQQVWQQELATIAADVAGAMYLIASARDALQLLQGRAGLIFAASESHLAAHREVSEVFEVAPATFVKITLQHGLECVGFLQSREHVISHGRNISFGADIVCGWFERSSLTSLTASQRAKLYVTGPSTLLQSRPGPPRSSNAAGGLVCENLHSVRLKASGDHQSSFMDIFFSFCGVLAREGEGVTLRPHPGGQYVLKNKIALPENVQLNMLPLYEMDLGSYAFGISAPSTIVFDMVLAGIPVGLWRDPAGIMDAGNYRGLVEISTVEEWLAFRRDVLMRPEMILARQAAFLQRLAMPIDPAEVYRRFAQLIVSALSFRAPVGAPSRDPATRLVLSGKELVEQVA